MTKDDYKDSDGDTLVNKGKTPLILKGETDDGLLEDSDDDVLLDKVGEKLKSLKSRYKNFEADSDDSDEDRKFAVDKTPMTKEQYVGGADSSFRGNDSINQEREIRSDDYDDDMQEITFEDSEAVDDNNAPSQQQQQQQQQTKEPSSESSSLAPKKTQSTIASWFSRRVSTTSVSSKPSSVSISLQQNDGCMYTNKVGEQISYKQMISRYIANQTELDAASAIEKEQVSKSQKILVDLFFEYKSHDEQSNKSLNVDYEFWAKVVESFGTVLSEEPEELHKKIYQGIPENMRGIIWQIVLSSKSFSLEEFYTTKILEPSDHEKQIKKDLSRTRFIAESNMVDKLDGLYNIVKAYSLYDTEVGYTQGMAFLVVPLLMNMNESETFCCLVKLMKSYGLRELFLTEMPGLHLILYQFERLLEDLSPKLYTHLHRQGVKSSMYASQWFLTMFSYKFPLEIVLRIFDILVVEGMESSLKFALALMVKNEEQLLQLSFDQLLDFLKDRLFHYYLIDESENFDQDQAAQGMNPFTFMHGNKSTNSVHDNKSNSYRTDELVMDASKIKIDPLMLSKFKDEYVEIHKLEKEREEELESLRTKNNQLIREIRKLEQSYAVLNKEHVEVANEMIQGKVNLANLEDENGDLRQEISQLEEKIKQLELEQKEQIEQLQREHNESKEEDRIQVEQIQKNQVNIEEEIKKTMERNLEVMESNRFLEEQLGNLEKQFRDTQSELEIVKKEHEELTKKWNVAKSFFDEN